MAPRTFFDYTDRATKGGGIIKDAIQNLLVWNWWLAGNDTGVDWILQDRTGVEIRRGTFDPATGVTPDWKLDWVDAAQAGPDVFFTCGGHEAISSPTRHNPVWGYVLPGVLVPFARNPAGGDPTLAQAYPPEHYAGTGTGGGETVDYDRIKSIVAAEVDRHISYYGSGSIGPNLRQGLEDKAKDAAIELLTADDQRGQAYRAALIPLLMNGLYQWAKDRAYEGASAAINDSKEATA